jgi:hypothetical protein
MCNVNVMRKRVGNILSDGINKYVLFFVSFFTAPVREINCHPVCTEEINYKVYICMYQ